MQIDQNIAQCIKTIFNIGSTTYVNICKDTTQVVSWGTADWLGFYFLCGFGSVVLLLLIALGCGFIKMIFESY